MAKPRQAPTVLLGFDFGMRKIGVAVGQMLTGTATPLSNISAQDGVPDWNVVKALIEKWHADALVVGIPYNMDGTEQNTTFAARRFAHKLEGRFHLRTHLVDERLTTIEARSQAFDESAPSRNKTDIDSIAAQLILESWMNSSQETDNS